MTVRRFDTSPLQATRTAAGALRGDARFTRTGVLTYRNADGSERRELRHPDEVFRADSLATLALVPITLDHPVEPVTSANAKKYAIGAVGDSVKRDGSFVRAPYAIHDDAAIAEIESGAKREISCGYDCDLDMTPGVYNGERYDGIQRNIVYNHAAILKRGRAGSEVRIDGLGENEAISCVSEFAEESRARADGENMRTILIHGLSFSVDDKIADAFKLHLDGMDAEAAKLRKELADAKAESDKTRARADAAEETIKTLKNETSIEALNRKIAARVALYETAKRAGLPSGMKLDALSDDEIKRAVIMKIQPNAKLEGQSVDYVRARFDAAIESLTEDGEIDDVDVSHARFNIARVHADSADGEAGDAESARKKMIERSRNAWRGEQAKR